MKPFSILAVLLCVQSISGQTYRYVYNNLEDKTQDCYLEVLPETKPYKGLIIRDFSRLPDTANKSPYSFTDLALERGFVVLFVTTSNTFPELYFNDNKPEVLDAMVAKVIEKNNLPKQNIFIGGISASGTRALRYAQYCNQGKSKNKIEIAGVFAVDSPLDMERFYRSSKHILERNAENGMLWEANLMIELLDKQMGGSPDASPKEYQKASVYSYSLPDGGNAKLLLKTPLLIYHEPDVDWWLAERSATLYDINSFDIVAFVGELHSQGNDDVTLKTTTGKGLDREGKRKPHSWSIVDEVELINWIEKHCN
jgi:hypothetical protein